MSGYLPAGADIDSEAPYNKKDPEKIAVDILISMTISLSTKVYVEEGYDENELKKAAESQIQLPNDLNSPFKIWEVDEFVVIKE